MRIRVRRLVAATSIRRRLLVGVLGTLMLVVVAIAGVEYVVLRNYLYDGAATRLHDDLRQSFVVRFSDGGGSTTFPQFIRGGPASGSPSTPVAGPGAAAVPGTPASARPTPVPIDAGTAARIAAQLRARDIAAELLAADGSVLAAQTAGSQAGGRTPFTIPSGLPLPGPSVAGAPASATSTRVDSGGYHLLVYLQRIPGVGGPVIVVATDLGPEDSTLRTMLLVTVLGGAGAMLGAGLLLVPILRGSLRPLRRVADTADRIAAGDLGQRADLPHRGDEVGRLGDAFDRMVDRVQSSLEELRGSMDTQARLVDRLREQDAATRRFVADASHELRTPLTAIRGQSQVLSRGRVDDPDVAEGLTHIHAEAERMSRLVNDLLLLSRADSGAPGPARDRLDLGALVVSETARWEALAPAHAVRVTAVPAPVDGDREALLRAVANLVSNAAKFSPSGGAIDIGVAVRAGVAEVSVRDHGPGIGDAERELVFERFHRGDPARARATGGTGLGLAIVRAIATEHGGGVAVRDSEGRGALLVMSIPTAGSDASGDAPADGARGAVTAPRAVASPPVGEPDPRRRGTRGRAVRRPPGGGGAAAGIIEPGGGH